MLPISTISVGAARPWTAVGGAEKAAEGREPEEKTGGPQPKPVMDEYRPEEKREPSGLYWLGKDEEGRPKIYFDDPDQAADSPEMLADAPGTLADVPGTLADVPETLADAPGTSAGVSRGDNPEQGRGAEGPDGGGEEICTGSTDQVDREIETLKRKRAELEQRLRSETDEGKIRDLERELARVEEELREKDSDTYRRRHTVFSTPAHSGHQQS